jgi:hypothetical protein
MQKTVQAVLLRQDLQKNVFFSNNEQMQSRGLESRHIILSIIDTRG